MKMDVTGGLKCRCLLLIFLLAFAPCWSGYAQESDDRIEKRIPVELRERPDVAVLLDRLRSLRRNETKFGPKHPSRGVVLSQIEEVEEKLKSLLNPETNQGGELDRNGLEKVPLEGRAMSSDWGFSIDSSWPKTLRELMGKLNQFSSYQEAYPLLQLRGIHAAGPFPGMGLVWGIQYDPVQDFSYVWTWFDHQGVAQRKLFFESPGKLESLYFPSDFDRSGEVWILRCKSVGNSTFELLALSAQRTPPFEIASEGARTLFEFFWNPPKGHNALGSCLSTRQHGWYFPGSLRPTGLVTASNVQCIQVDDEMWVLERPDWRSSQIERQEFIQAVAPEEIQKDIRTHRKIIGLAEDSARDILMVDQSGRLFRKRLQNDVRQRSVGLFAEQLNQLEWVDFEDLGSPRAPFKRQSMQSDGSKSEGCLELLRSQADQGLSFESYLCVPKQSLFDRDQSDGADFPDGTILLANILASEREISNGSIGKRIEETRIMVYADGEWYPAFYQWDQDNTRAVLRSGEKSSSGFGAESQRFNGEMDWRVTSTVGCVECHKQREVWFSRIATDERLLYGVQIDTQKLEHDPLDWMGSNHRNLLNAEVDWDWFRESFMDSTVEPWYRNSIRSSGGFDTELDTQWRPVAKSKVSLSGEAKMIYCMAAGAIASQDQRFLIASRDGASFVLKNLKDLQVGRSGQVVGAGLLQEGVANVARENANFIFAFAFLAGASDDKRFLRYAMDCWIDWRDYVLGDSAELTLLRLEFLSALLELYERTRDRGLRGDIEVLLDTLARTARESTGFLTTFRDDAQDGSDEKEEFELGSQADWAFEVSRAVELGFPRRYLSIGLRAIDSVCSKTDEIGSLEVGSPATQWNGRSRAQILRAAIRYWAMHERSELADSVWTLLELIKQKHIDSQHGGWLDQGESIRRAPFHEVRMYLEGMRIASKLK